jgi:phosphoglycolate phosphatase
MAAIIFDFDGTIADSFDYVAEFLAKEAGHDLDKQQLEALRGQSMPAMARQLGFRWWRLPRLFLRGRHNMNKVISQLQPIKGMPEVIKHLHAEGHELFIVTSNTVKNVHKFLHRRDLQTYFVEVYGGISLFGKAPALRHLLREHYFDIENAIYIGDETRDIEAAQFLNLRVVAVSWGFAKLKNLKSKQPNAIVDSPAELLSFLENI